MGNFILAIDQGTSSSRAIVFDDSGKQIALAQREFTQIYPQPGWVEHDASEIWSTQIGVAAEAITKANLKTDEIAAIGITNQRETTVLWNKETGQPLHNAIVWQDRRTSEYCDQLRAQGHHTMVQEKTGLILDAYFSATKIKWILDQIPEARELAASGKIAFGTIDSWLVWNLTKGEVHITDVSNASRTMLYNIHTQQWDKELLDLFEIPSEILPEVKASSELYGKTAGRFLASRIPIAGIAGDQQAALFGQLCTQPGMVKNTYGTGCFMLMNIGDQPILSKNNLVTTIAWKIDNKVQYALEGSIFIGGAVVQWLRDGLEIIKSSEDIEALARSVDDNGGVYMVPAFAGLGAPHWNQYARGTVFGLTRGSTKAHIARAALESIAFQTLDILKAMEADSGISIQELRVDGGATANDLLMQFQADILKTRVIKPENTELTAIGAAYLAGLATGVWSSTDEIQEQWKISKEYTAQAGFNNSDLIKNWQRAVRSVNLWANNK